VAFTKEQLKPSQVGKVTEPWAAINQPPVQSIAKPTPKKKMTLEEVMAILEDDDETPPPAPAPVKSITPEVSPAEFEELMKFWDEPTDG
jgi:hypothetical protein